MSTPLNPLSNFNSYAYHHILVACSNTDVANAIAESNSLSHFERTSPRGKYAPISIGDLGGYIVLINGMSDAEFYIDGVNWGSTYVPSGTTVSTYDWNSIETDGEMRVFEPNGMRFINVLSEASVDLNVAAASMVFLLKTVFVGQRGDTAIETIPGIRPVVFNLINLRASFDYTGAVYTLLLVGGRDGYAKHPGISHVISGSNLTLNNTQNIGDAMDALADKANSLYQIGKKKGVDQRAKVLAQGETYEESIDFLPLEYIITYDDEFTEHLVATNDIDGTSNNGDSHTVSFQPDLDIQAGITRIIETSASFMDETAIGSDHDGRNRKFTFKVTDEVTTSKDKMFIKYHVNFYELTDTEQIPNVVIGNDVLPPKDHVIEWDYVYTGKNIDILDFKIELDLALSYFMALPVAKPLAASQAETLIGTKVDSQPGNSSMIEAPGTNTALSPSGNPKGPFFIGPPARNQTNKRKKALETNNARNVLESYAAMSTIGVTLVIHGNPLLIEERKLSTTTSGLQSLDREADSTEETTPTFNPQWEKIPVYCKINIQMPTSSNNPGEYEPFWYQGYYRINKVRHIFEAGEFTQELEIYSIPSATNFRNKASNTGEPIPPTVTKTPPAATPEIPTSVEATSENVPSVLFSEFDDKIVEESAKFNIDPNLIRSVIKQESNFDPNAVSPVGASGLGQLMKGTARSIANQLEEQGLLDEPFIMNSTRDDRFDPMKNIEFAAYLLDQNLTMFDGDVDLALAAYNAGPTAVRAAGNAIPQFTETIDYVKKINQLVALAEKQIPKIPAIPTGPDIGELAAREAFNTFTGVQN